MTKTNSELSDLALPNHHTKVKSQKGLGARSSVNTTHVTASYVLQAFRFSDLSLLSHYGTMTQDGL